MGRRTGPGLRPVCRLAEVETLAGRLTRLLVEADLLVVEDLLPGVLQEVGDHRGVVLEDPVGRGDREVLAVVHLDLRVAQTAVEVFRRWAPDRIPSRPVCGIR